MSVKSYPKDPWLQPGIPNSMPSSDLPECGSTQTGSVDDSGFAREYAPTKGRYNSHQAGSKRMRGYGNGESTSKSNLSNKGSIQTFRQVLSLLVQNLESSHAFFASLENNLSSSFLNNHSKASRPSTPSYSGNTNKTANGSGFDFSQLGRAAQKNTNLAFTCERYDYFNALMQAGQIPQGQEKRVMQDILSCETPSELGSFRKSADYSYFSNKTYEHSATFGDKTQGNSSSNPLLGLAGEAAGHIAESLGIGSVEAQGRLQGAVWSGSLDETIGNEDANLRVRARLALLEGELRGKAGAGYKDGNFYAHASASGSLDLIRFDAELNGKIAGVGEAHVKGHARVGVNGQANARVQIGKDGVYAEGGFSAFAAAEAKVDGSFSLESGAKGKFSASALVGFGAEANFSAGYKDGVARFKCDLGLAFIFGARFSFDVSIDFNKVGNFFLNTGKKIANTFTSFGKTLKSAGSKVAKFAQKVGSKIKEGAEKVINKAGSFLKKAGSAILGIFGF